MSILIYRDLNGSDVVIKSPTDTDFGEFYRVLFERHKDEIIANLKRDMLKSPLAAYINTSME